MTSYEEHSISDRMDSPENSSATNGDGGPLYPLLSRDSVPDHIVTGTKGKYSPNENWTTEVTEDSGKISVCIPVCIDGNWPVISFIFEKKIAGFHLILPLRSSS